MVTSLKVGAALLMAVLVLVCGAAALHGHALAFIAFASLGLAGVTYNYTNPGSGTVPATQAQATRKFSQTMELTFAEPDTLATFTHNWGLSTVELARDRPWVINWPKGGTLAPNFTFGLNSNTVSIFKAAASGSASITVITLLRPHSIIK